MINSKIFVIMISALVLGLLIFSVPAKALVLNLDVKNNNVEKGQLVVLDASIDISSSDSLPSKLILKLIGNTTKTCEFTVDGIILSGCDGMTITRTSNISRNFGYGYGYGYGYGTTNGKLSYRIVIDTKNYEFGNYATQLNAYIGNNIVSQSGRTITVSTSSNAEYESDASSTFGKVCTAAFTCSAWSDCVDGKQVRTCEAIPNCYFKSYPAEARICVESENIGVLKLVAPYSQLRLGNNVAGEDLNISKPDVNNSSMIILLFALIILIVALLILILIVVLLRRVGQRKKAIKKKNHLNKISYKPVKY